MSTSGFPPLDAPRPGDPSPEAASPDPAVQPGDAPTSHGSGCAHCDDSVPHEHVDVAASVGTAEDALARSARRTLALTLAAGLVPILAVTVLPGPVLPTGVMLAVIVGVCGWALGSVVGIVLTRSAMRDGAGAASGRQGRLHSEEAAGAGVRGLVLGAIVLAALAPVTGWVATALSVPGEAASPAAAVAAAGGWALAAGAISWQATRGLRRLLREPGEAGEAARQAAVHGAFGASAPTGWLLHPAAVAVWGALGALLPVTLVVTTVLHVAVTLGAAVRRTRAA